MPEPGGLSVAEAEGILAGIRERTDVLGAGFSGASFEPANIGPMSRLATALAM
jgi:hypothetical protein